MRGPLRVHRTEDRKDCETGGIVARLWFVCVAGGSRVGGSGCVDPKKEGVTFSDQDH